MAVLYGDKGFLYCRRVMTNFSIRKPGRASRLNVCGRFINSQTGMCVHCVFACASVGDMLSRVVTGSWSEISACVTQGAAGYVTAASD